MLIDGAPKQKGLHHMSRHWPVRRVENCEAGNMRSSEDDSC